MTNYMKDLRKTLEEAEGLFRECEEHAKDLHGADLTLLALFRHIMQMGDGILILAEAKSSGPMFPLMRAMVEGFFSLNYILERDLDAKDWKRRSLAWLVFCINQAIALYDITDFSTTRGKTFRSELRAGCDSIGREIINHLDRSPYPQDGSRPLYERLEEPDLVKLQEEYRARKYKPSYFFELVDTKISGMEGLARKIKRWPEYKIFYKPFSHRVHGTDFLNLLEVKESGEVRFDRLRTTDEQEFLVDLAEAVLKLAGSILAHHYKTQAEAISRQNNVGNREKEEQA